MRRTLDAPYRAAAWVQQGQVGSCRSDLDLDRARSGQAAELTMSVFGRLSFFGAGPSTAYIGGGRSSAMAVESVLYHQDEIQSAVWVLLDQIGAACLAGLKLTCQPHKARARKVCRTWPMRAWWHRFRQP